MSKDDNATLVLGSSNAHEILVILMQTLEEEPERSDLWMMRFQVLSVHGLKPEFVSAMQEASSNPMLRRDIDWIAVGRMWHGLAPGEPPPEGVRLRKSDIQTPSSMVEAKDDSAPKLRRFSDMAQQIARAELDKLTQDYQAIRSKPDFSVEFARKMRDILQRPTPMHHASELERALDGSAKIFFKREDLRHTTPEAEVAAAQAHIAVLLGKSLLLTGNDVDEFSVALAQIAPRFGLKAIIVVRPDDIQDKPELIEKLRKLDANIEIMDSKKLRSKDPREGALRLWTQMNATSHLALSLGTGPPPYPRMISDFQMQLGFESELQLRALVGPGRRRSLVAAVHSEADSIGFVLPYLRRKDIDVFYAETEAGIRGHWRPSARLRAYNGARREHGWLRATGRIVHIPIIDAHAQYAQDRVHRLEGISIGLEDARAVALATGLTQSGTEDRDIVVLVS